MFTVSRRRLPRAGRGQLAALLVGLCASATGLLWWYSTTDSWIPVLVLVTLMGAAVALLQYRSLNSVLRADLAGRWVWHMTGPAAARAITQSGAVQLLPSAGHWTTRLISPGGASFLFTERPRVFGRPGKEVVAIRIHGADLLRCSPDVRWRFDGALKVFGGYEGPGSVVP